MPHGNNIPAGANAEHGFPRAGEDGSWEDETSVFRTLRERASRFWRRHRALIWILHSVWALAVGTTIVLVAQDRYYLVLWVVVFLILAWALTLFLAGRLPRGSPPAGSHLGSCTRCRRTSRA